MAFWSRKKKEEKKEEPGISYRDVLAAVVLVDRAKHKINTYPKYFYDLVTDPAKSLAILCQQGFLIKESDNHYIQTDKGKELLKEYGDFAEFYHDAHRDYSFEEYLEARNNLSFRGSYNDVKWSILNKKLLELYQAPNPGRLAYVYQSMYLILAKENKTKQALGMLIKSLYCSLAELDVLGFKPQPTDDDWTAPVIKEFLHDHRELFDDGMIEECLRIPVSNPPTLERMKAVIYPYVRG